MYRRVRDSLLERICEEFGEDLAIDGYEVWRDAKNKRYNIVDYPEQQLFNFYKSLRDWNKYYITLMKNNYDIKLLDYEGDDDVN